MPDLTGFDTESDVALSTTGSAVAAFVPGRDARWLRQLALPGRSAVEAAGRVKQASRQCSRFAQFAEPGSRVGFL